MILTLAALTFAPIRFVHPLRVKQLRVLNIVLLALWAALGLVAIVQNLEPSPYVTWVLVAIAVYFFMIGFLRRPS
jgi:phosphatidylcholine synthase